MKSPSKMNNSELKVALKQAQDDIVIAGNQWAGERIKLMKERDKFKDQTHGIYGFTSDSGEIYYGYSDKLKMDKKIAKRDKIIIQELTDKCTELETRWTDMQNRVEFGTYTIPAQPEYEMCVQSAPVSEGLKEGLTKMNNQLRESYIVDLNKVIADLMVENMRLKNDK